MLKRLEMKGYVKRIRSERDKRDLIVCITEKGEQLKYEAKAIPAKLSQCIKLETEKAEQVYTLLYKLLDELTKLQEV